MGGAGRDSRAEKRGDDWPRRIGGYELVRWLGSGGMGTVFQARQVAMDRLVALKILSPRLASDRVFVERFLREARSAGRLRHPHIVQAHDAGFADGHYYFAMEYVDGEGLDAVLKRDGPLRQGRALALLKQVCSALAVAHKAGIVHRDIKLSNLMVDREGAARVTDFGLAKRLEGDVSVTQTGESLGTPLYMAPEVAAGEAASARSDLYSLGATFHHLLAGRPPFQGRTPAELIVQHATREPPPLATVAPHVDRRLCDIVDRLLRKDPAERPASAQELVEQLEALGDLEATLLEPAPGQVAQPAAPTATLPPGKRMERQYAARRLARQQRAARRRKLAMAVAAGAAVVAAVALIAWAATRGTTTGRDGAAKPPTSAGTHVAPGDQRERVAQDLIQRVEFAASQGNWQGVPALVDRLERDFADTKAYAARRADLASLRAKALAALPPGPATSLTPTPLPGGWLSMFDGKTLDGWHVIEEFPTPWGGRGGQVYVEGGAMVFARQRSWAGVAWLRDFPVADYEVEFEAQRVEGKSTFCGIVFPIVDPRRVGMLEVGGLGGTTVGLAGLDGKNANANETTAHVEFENGRWYRLRLRLAGARLQVWIDDEQLIDYDLQGHRVDSLSMLAPIRPFGFCSDTGKAALRNIRLRRLAP